MLARVCKVGQISEQDTWDAITFPDAVSRECAKTDVNYLQAQGLSDHQRNEYLPRHQSRQTSQR